MAILTKGRSLSDLLILSKKRDYISESATITNAGLAAYSDVDLTGMPVKITAGVAELVEASAPVTVTFANATEIFSATAHGFIEDDRITLGVTGSGVLPAGGNFLTTISYFVLLIDDDDFQLSLTPGGAAVTGSDDGTAVITANLSFAEEFANGIIISNARANSLAAAANVDRKLTVLTSGPSTLIQTGLPLLDGLGNAYTIATLVLAYAAINLPVITRDFGGNLSEAQTS